MLSRMLAWLWVGGANPAWAPRIEAAPEFSAVPRPLTASAPRLLHQDGRICTSRACFDKGPTSNDFTCPTKEKSPRASPAWPRAPHCPPVQAHSTLMEASTHRSHLRGTPVIPLHWNNGLILWGKLDPSAPTLLSGLNLNSSLEWKRSHRGVGRAREQSKALELNHVVP